MAITALSQTITHLTKQGRFRQAADREKEIGQIYLQELHDLQKACESLERAGEWYIQEDAQAYVVRLYRSLWLLISYSTANACFKDAADLHADLEQYPQAIARYEQVADASLSSALTKYSVKEYWLRACLCALAMGVSRSLLSSGAPLMALQDTVTSKRNLTKYSSLDTTFSSTREAKFINIITEAIEAGDVETFTGAVFEYDQVMRLDNWKTSILSKIKKNMQTDDIGIL